MPVLFTGREPDDVTGADLLNWPALALGPTAAGRDNERLTEWMCVPRGSCARLERYAGALNKCRIRSLEKWIDPHRTGEPVRRSFCGGLRACSFDFHTFLILTLWCDSQLTSHSRRIQASCRARPIYLLRRVCTLSPASPEV